MLHYSTHRLASHYLLTYTGSGVILHWSLLYSTSTTAICKQLRVGWEFISVFNLKPEHPVIRGSKSCAEKKLQAKMKRITHGLPVFRFVDREYDSWCGGLLLDGGQEGKFAFTPEQLHHFLCDVCRGVNCSPNIWKNKVKWTEIMSVCKLFSQAMSCLPPMCALAKQHIKLVNHTWWNSK